MGFELFVVLTRMLSIQCCTTVSVIEQQNDNFLAFLAIMSEMNIKMSSYQPELVGQIHWVDPTVDV